MFKCNAKKIIIKCDEIDFRVTKNKEWQIAVIVATIKEIIEKLTAQRLTKCNFNVYEMSVKGFTFVNLRFNSNR